MGGKRFDVVVVGGGLTGLAAACGLARAGRAVAIVEGRRGDSAGDGRVSALTIASERILRGLGAWDRLAGIAAPFREIRVWEAPGGPEVHFDAAAIAAPHLGHIVENREVEAALASAAGALGIFWHRPARLTSIHRGRDEIVAVLDRTRLTARVLVGADGGDSTVRALAGIATRTRDYGQHGIVCTVHPERHHADTAWQVFRPPGPLAFLPLPEGRCSIVWSTETAHASRLLGLSGEEFERALEGAFEQRLGRILGAGPRTAFPLRRIRAVAYRAPRIALMGDSAHTIHPLAGQGVNLGLIDAAAFTEEVTDAIAKGRDPGGEACLARYERRRKGHNLAAEWTMDGFDFLFRLKGGGAWTVRNLGFGAANRLPSFKNCVMRRAAGLAGDLPRAAMALDPG